MALSANVIGVSVTSVANKMSLVIPVLFALIYLNESIGIIKIAGLLLALIGVYLTSKTDDRGDVKTKHAWMLPLIVFIGSGIIDTLFKYNELRTLGEFGLNAFLAWIFYISFFIGLFQIFYARIKTGETFQLKALWGGLLLGIPNFASGYFLVKTLSVSGFESSVIFPVNNMAIVSISAIAGIFFFKEKISVTNIWGIALSLLAIVVLALSAY
jgi:drug/metabolite transporter (DMT)-like permease